MKIVMKYGFTDLLKDMMVIHGIDLRTSDLYQYYLIVKRNEIQLYSKQRVFK